MNLYFSEKYTAWNAQGLHLMSPLVAAKQSLLCIVRLSRWNAAYAMNSKLYASAWDVNKNFVMSISRSAQTNISSHLLSISVENDYRSFIKWVLSWPRQTASCPKYIKCKREWFVMMGLSFLWCRLQLDWKWQILSWALTMLVAKYGQLGCVSQRARKVKFSILMLTGFFKYLQSIHNLWGNWPCCIQILPYFLLWSTPYVSFYWSNI